MMLRVSGQDLGDGLNLRAVVDGVDAESGVPGGKVLVAFVEAALTGAPDLGDARAAVANELGPEAVVDAAAVIGNFQRMTRIADATGIPVDEMTAEVTRDIQQMLGLEAMPSARLPG